MQEVKIEELIQVSDEFIDGMKLLETRGKWTVKSKEPYLIQEMPVKGRVVLMASSTINIPFEKICAFFSDPQFMRICSDNVGKLDVLLVKKLGDRIIKVINVIVKMPKPVADRQIVAVNTSKIEGNIGYFGNRTCLYPVKLDPSTVVADAYIAGFKVQKISESKCKVLTISDIDIKGSIPAFVQNYVATKRVDVMENLEKKINQWSQ